jgi:hypothetical protein
MTLQGDKDLLLRVVTQLAQKQLASGGFIPFGAVLGSKRDIRILMPKSMKQGVAPAELDAYWTRELREAAKTEECKAVCSCTDIRIETDEGALATAVLIHVEHAQGDAEDILYPCRNEEGRGVIFSEPARESTKQQIFNHL